MIKESTKVLDHGYVKYIDHMGSDEAIIEAARMSTDGSFKNWKRDQVLLAYLYEHQHMTPFECGGELIVEVQVPLFVAREWHRHRTQSYNELSARYTQMPNIHYLPVLNRFQKQCKQNLQGSTGTLDNNTSKYMRNELLLQQQNIYSTYDNHLEQGLAREIARINTPVSRYTRFRAKTDLRNWLGFLKLRMAPNAQYEIRCYAWTIADIIKELWPRTYKLFEEHDLYGHHLSRSQVMELMRAAILPSRPIDKHFLKFIGLDKWEEFEDPR